MTAKRSMVWGMDAIFAGGSSSEPFRRFVEETERDTKSLLDELKRAAEERNGRTDTAAQATHERLADWTERLQRALARLREAESYVSCLAAERMDDRQASAWTERVQTLAARYRQAADLFDAALAAMPEDEWRDWLSAEERRQIAYPLDERRQWSRDKLPPAYEGLVGELSVDGYHGWGELYQTIVSRIEIPWEEGGVVSRLSAGQAANKLDHPDPAVRDAMMAKWEEAWAAQADLCADALNRIAGFRLKLYRARGWNDPLAEPLRLNRMSAGTLEAMWDAVQESVQPLQRYLALKAARFGKPRLQWHDVEAPVSASGARIGYDEAAELIVDAFAAFSPDMAKLAERAFAERWIEAEDRPGKRPGGFCTGFPVAGTSRIFMTYSGTPGNVSTLAHELGHAYHGERTVRLPAFAQEYAMNVAETASTFAESLVSDALLKRAAANGDKLALLDDRLQRAVAFCMNIRARFLFETRLYAMRPDGLLDPQTLSRLMTEAQREAYGDALGAWHPHFWASKLHFYLTDVPFYNFPYTFGFLFSTGIAAIAQAEGPSFRTRYDRLLEDTGVMMVEELASRHLGVDLAKPAFWREAVARVTADVDAFASLCVESNDIDRQV